jgi:dihydrodipicolinate synthase/N-acetylneuraminate lyase
MVQMTLDWRGYWVASPTPFTVEGAIDFPAFKSLIDFYVTQGIHGLVVNGSTGEWCSQGEAERKGLAAIAVEQVAGRIPIIIGASAYTATEVINLANHALSIGASGIMVTPPPYYNLTESEIYNFYRFIDNQVAIPIMVYNWPRGIGVDMSETLLVKLGKLPQIVAIKESSGDEDKTISVLKRIIAESIDVKFFARFIHPRGAEFLQTVGGDGNIDGGGLGAQYAVGFYESWWRNDTTVMQMNSVAYSDFSSQLINSDYSGKFASPISQLKACMRLLGQPGGYVRPPLMDIFDTDILARLEAILKSSGIGVSQNQ